MYRGIQCLRSADDDDIRPTPAQEEEIRKCKESPEYFFRNYCYIHNAEQGRISFQPRPRQVAELPVLSGEKLVKSDWYRQSGYTTLVMAFMLWKAMFTPWTSCLYMVPKKALAYENFDEMVRKMYLGLPLWLQTGIKEWTEKGIQFANGSIYYARAASTKNALGIGWDYIFIDEFGWIKDKAMLEIVNTVFPGFHYSKSEHLILGQSHRFGRQTPANLMFWKNTAMPFHVSEFTWDQDERLDKKWADDMVMRIGKARFDREYGGVIKLSDQGFEPPERFGQWTFWKEGLHPNVKEQQSDRYLCAVVAIHRATGLPVCQPFQEVLTVDGNGIFHGLMSNGDVYQKVVAWMPLPELPDCLR